MAVNGEKKQRSRKFQVVVLTGIIMLGNLAVQMFARKYGMAEGLSSYEGMMTAGMVVLTAYIGGNAWQKSCELKNGKNGKKN